MAGNAAMAAAMGGAPPGAGPGPFPSWWAGQLLPGGQDLIGNQAVAAQAGALPAAQQSPSAQLPEQQQSARKPDAKKPEPKPVRKAKAPPAPRPVQKDQQDQKDRKETEDRPGKGAKKQEATGPRSPGADPKFQALKKDVAAKKQRVASSHPPPAAEAGAAQGAAVPPADDQEARGKAAHAEDMDAAQPKEFDKQSFIAAVEKAIKDRAPKNLDEADKFGESGKAEEVKTEVQGKVGEGKDAAGQEIADTTAATPEPAPDAKEVVPLAADSVPGKPGAPNPNQAAPDALPKSATDMSAGPDQVNQQMASAQVTEQQLSMKNSGEPAFDKAVRDKKTMEAHSAAAPKELRAGEAAELKKVKATAATSGAAAMGALHATRVATGQQVTTGKEGTKGRDEDKRTKVTALLQKVFDETKGDVEEILSGLDKKVDTQFTNGEKRARDRFTDEHTRGMDEYKSRRYSGLRGKARWVKDLFADLPEEANRIYERARDNYLTAMRQVISDVADTVEGELRHAKDRIAKGRKDLQHTVDTLPKDLRAIGREAAADFQGKFDELSDTVNDKGTELVDTLATKYTEAVKSVDAEIAAEKEKNKGLVSKAADAIGGVINTIKELGRLLMGVLRKAASAVGLILKDPVGFLGRLITGVGGGLNLFMKNAGRHLQQGVLAWLLGSGVTAGLVLPTSFDVLGILVMIAGLLGLSWPNIRARLARKVNPKTMAAAETGKDAIPIVVEAKRRGVAGLWSDLKSRVGDLKKDLISKLVSYLLPTIIIAGVTWIVSLFNPASAFIRACKMIIDIVRFIVTQGRQIIEFVNTVLDAVIAIARGGTGGVPALVERALARSIPVLIGALAAILGIGGIAGKVKQIFQALSRPVSRAIDWVITKITGLLKKLAAKLKPKRKKPKRPQHRRKPTRPRRPRRPAKPKRPRKAKKPDRRKNRKREDRRTDQDKRRALDAAIRDANRLIGDGNATVKSVRAGLPDIKRRHRLTSISLKKSGDLHHIRLAINPNGKSKDAALEFDFANTGKVFAEKVHTSWWDKLLSKAKSGSNKQLWQRSVLDKTESEAVKYAGSQSVTQFREKHPRAADNKEVAVTYLFKAGSAIRTTFLDKLGGDEGALPKLKTTGKKAAEGDEKTVNDVEEMVFDPALGTYGRWDPFPSRDADADKDLVAAVKLAGGLDGFLETMVRTRRVGDVNWTRFGWLWDNDTPSREFIKGHFRDLNPGTHEWIPTNYILQVLEVAIAQHKRGNVEKGLDWLRLQDALRSPTNVVIWRILDGEGLVSLGAHVGTFYTDDRKPTLTNGTKEFHDRLRALYMQNRTGTARAYVTLLIEMLGSDAQAGPSGFQLMWSGGVGAIPSEALGRSIDVLFREKPGDLKKLTLLELSGKQKKAFAAVRLTFAKARDALKG
ncbi:hypothetical protein [Streptomyces himastatinicus]|nr:hypothetical protein [Streptomyces himastatinicus]